MLISTLAAVVAVITAAVVLARRFTRLEGKVDAVRDDLNHKIDSVGDGLNHKIDAVEDGLNHRIDAVGDGLNHKIDTVRDELDHKIDTVRDHLDHKIDTLRNGLNQSIRQTNNMLELLSVLVGVLSKQQVIDKDAFATIVREFATISRIDEISPNPISLEETNRINAFIRKARRGEFFTKEEVREYSALVRKLEKEKPNDPSIASLVTFAAILRGLFLVTED
ncbi:MAG: hypothetical protein HYX90_06245 [Chloroflexi bacterium]|nr:hypothetical protein [Chloroflexota bacterium]